MGRQPAKLHEQLQSSCGAGCQPAADCQSASPSYNASAGALACDFSTLPFGPAVGQAIAFCRLPFPFELKITR
jgi:hypothetical protein